MPAGPAIPGFIYFVATKLGGYTAYCHWGIGRALVPKAVPCSTLLAEPAGLPTIIPPSSWKAGAIRTAIGIALGITVGLSFWMIPYFDHHDATGNILFFGLLVPVRIGEWWLLLRWVYPSILTSKRTSARIIAVGILVSFALDAIAVLAAFTLPGGMWVC